MTDHREIISEIHVESESFIYRAETEFHDATPNVLSIISTRREDDNELMWEVKILTREIPSLIQMLESHMKSIKKGEEYIKNEQ